MRCIVHDPPPADYDSRSAEGDFLPSLEELSNELVRHIASLRGPHASFWRKIHYKVDYYCGHCHEEYMVRTNGIEWVLIEEAAEDACIQGQCTCPPDSPNRDYFLKSLRRAYREVAA